jgi:hypothetical protein
MTTLETGKHQPQYSLVIDGHRIEAASGRRYDSVDPFLGEPWASAADGDAADVDAAVAAAQRALSGPWGQFTGFGRAALMRRLGDLIARDADRLAEIETRDTGKLLREMRGQLGTIPQWFHYFSGLADKLEGSTIPGDRPNFLVYTRREPAGVVAAIVPWNSPRSSKIPGGSSSGSAVAVAIGAADVAVGTDTGGSIRIPSACCATAGLKTTFGLISVEGVKPLAPSLDTVGPMARSVEGLMVGMSLLDEGFQPVRFPATPTIGRVELSAHDEIEAEIDRALNPLGWRTTILVP